MLNKRTTDKSKPISYGHKHQDRVEDRRGGAERLRSSGRGGRGGAKRNDNSSMQRVQRNQPAPLRRVAKKFSWWKGTTFWKWTWYKWLFGKNR
jgi:hypothetical protein